MTTATITSTFSACNSFPLAAVEPDPPVASARVPNSVSWRKAILLNRSALLSAWPRYFPQHSFSDLRLIQSPSPDWAERAWVWTAPEPPAPSSSAPKRAYTRPRAAASTVKALAFQLRGGVDTLRDSSARRRLADLSEQQLRELADHLGIWRWRRWSPDEIEVLIRIWGTNRANQG
jgi:hypothetical protein